MNLFKEHTKEEAVQRNKEEDEIRRKVAGAWKVSVNCTRPYSGADRDPKLFDDYYRSMAERYGKYYADRYVMGVDPIKPDKPNDY